MDYVAAIDVGTTNLKCQIFSSDFRVVGSSIQKVCITYIIRYLCILQFIIYNYYFVCINSDVDVKYFVLCS